MEIGEIHPNFRTFHMFCTYARQFPHVLEHDFAAAMEGYLQILGYRIFTLDIKYSDPYLPLYEQVYRFSEWIEKNIYPPLGGADLILISTAYKWLPLDIAFAYERELRHYWDLFKVEERNLVFNYVAPSAEKLVSFMTEYEIVLPTERVHLRDIPWYSILDERTAKYISRSTHIELTPVPSLVNKIKRRTLFVKDVSYPRAIRIQEIVTYPEEKQVPRIIRAF